MAKLILFSPKYLYLYQVQEEANRYFPMGLGYIASYLREKGKIDVSLYDIDVQKITDEGVVEILKRENPDFVGITSTTPTFINALKLARLVRESCYAKIIFGGVHVSAIPEYIIRKHSDLIDCIVVGEGEETLLELINAYGNKTGLGSVKGIVYLKDGETVSTGCREYIKDLDRLPFPARDLIPQNLYTPSGFKGSISISTSRGCPMNCNFCASRVISGKAFRIHSAEYVLDEMTMLKKDYNAKKLVIVDDTFTVDKSRLEKICKGMIERKLDMKWFGFSTVNAVDESMLRLMKKAGCRMIGFGAESSSKENLKRMGKSINPQRTLEAIQMSNKAGLITIAYYLIGFPFETREEMVDTIRFAFKARSTVALFNKLIPYPGTIYFDDFIRERSLGDCKWEDFVDTSEDTIIKNENIGNSEILELVQGANRYYVGSRLVYMYNTFKNTENIGRFVDTLLKQPKFKRSICS